MSEEEIDLGFVTIEQAHVIMRGEPAEFTPLLVSNFYKLVADALQAVTIPWALAGSIKGFQVKLAIHYVRGEYYEDSTPYIACVATPVYQ